MAKKYCVYESGKPADATARTYLKSDRWAKSRFDSFELACDYAKDYFGQYVPDDINFVLNEVVDYTGYGDTYEIREEEEE